VLSERISGNFSRFLIQEAKVAGNWTWDWNLIYTSSRTHIQKTWKEKTALEIQPYNEGYFWNCSSRNIWEVGFQWSTVESSWRPLAWRITSRQRICWQAGTSKENSDQRSYVICEDHCTL
jgi:hypothetical protein